MADDTNLEKIKLLDQIFQVLSLDDMKQIASCDLVVSKLRGDNVARGPLLEMYQDSSRLNLEIMMLRTNLTNVVTDFQVLIRCLNKGMADSTATSDFYNLKTKHNIY